MITGKNKPMPMVQAHAEGEQHLQMTCRYCSTVHALHACLHRVTHHDGASGDSAKHVPSAGVE